MSFIVASDHVAVPLKEAVVEHLQGEGISVYDAGPHSAEIQVDYPDVAQSATQALASGKFEQAVLICGTGLGMSIAANKEPGIRAALCHDPYTAHQARAHNNANVLCMGAWVVSPERVGLILDELKESGLEDNTLVMYLSDHGYLLNDHGRFEKHTMWAESIKAPLVIRGKNFPGGRESEEVVEFVDLVPTLCEALGVDIHADVQGESLMPLLTGVSGTHREFAFSEYLEDNMAMVASKKWKYVFATGKRDLGLGAGEPRRRNQEARPGEG